MANVLTISDTTTDFNDFVREFNNSLAASKTWKGTLTTQTSQTLVEMISALGVFDNAKMLRYYEDSFSDTVQSDGAIRAIAVMQGIRLTRKLPAKVSVEVVSSADLTLSAYAQFSVGGQYFFNRDQLVFVADVPQTVSLYEGRLSSVQLTGIGSDFQVFLSQDDSFAVSDQDVVVVLNQTLVPKAYGGLWNYEAKPGYSDLTHPDGRLMVQFGSTKYGTVPQVNDQLTIMFVTTLGSDGNVLSVKGSSVLLVGSSLISGTCSSTPSGGADEKNTLAYKNVEAGAFGAYASAVTRDQYRALVNTYPGIVDAITQAQREINPTKVEWMNVIRVSALTSSPWDSDQKKAFCKYCQQSTMFSPHFLWQDPIPMVRDVAVEVYCYNTAVPSVVETRAYAALKAMFEPRPGILLTNFYPSDLDATVRAASPGAVSYVKIVSPLEDMIVTAPPSPELYAEIEPGAGALTPLLYSYGVSTVLANGEEGSPTNWVFPQITNGHNGSIRLTWIPVGGAASYRIWGRKAGSIGFLASVPAATHEWLDDGSIVASGQPPNALQELPIRYNQLRNLKVNAYFADRQQRFDK